MCEQMKGRHSEIGDAMLKRDLCESLIQDFPVSLTAIGPDGRIMWQFVWAGLNR